MGSLDQRFTPFPTAAEGVLGHLVVASRRNHNYLTEITFTGEYQNIFVRGRADGYDPCLNQLEEVAKSSPLGIIPTDTPATYAQR